MCVVSAAMMSGVHMCAICCCDRHVSSIWCIAWCCMGHWKGFSKLQNDLQHRTCSSRYSKSPVSLSGFSQKHCNEVLVS